MWYKNTVRYYSVTKNSKFELVELRGMSLESVIQSEVSQKEKNKYCYIHIYTYVCIILKNGTDEPTLQAGMERIHREWTCGLSWVRRGWDDLGA